MNNTRLIRIGLALFITLAASGFYYLLFTSGRLPGIYPLAFAYSWLLSPLVSLSLLVLLRSAPLLIAVILALAVAIFYTHRRVYRRALAVTLIGPLLAVTLLPAMISFTPSERLFIAPWNQVYRTVYASLWLDGNYGDVLMFQCDSTGFFCWQTHEFYSDVSSAGSLPLVYDAQRDLLSLGVDPVVYVRSQDQTICSVHRQSVVDRGSCELAL